MISRQQQAKVLLEGIPTEDLAAELKRRKAKRVSDRAKALRVKGRVDKWSLGDLDVLDTLADADAPMVVRAIGDDIGMVQQGVRRVLDRLVAKAAVRKHDTSPTTYSILQRGRDALAKEVAGNTFPKRN